MRWDVRGADYVVWRRLLALSGDDAMGARLDALHAARQSGCKTALALDGGVTRMPLMLVAEAAVAAQQGKSETQWREQWVRALVTVAGHWQDEPTLQRIVVVLNAMEAIILDMRSARVWPWPGESRSAGTSEQR